MRGLLQDQGASLLAVLLAVRPACTGGSRSSCGSWYTRSAVLQLMTGIDRESDVAGIRDRERVFSSSWRI